MVFMKIDAKNSSSTIKGGKEIRLGDNHFWGGNVAGLHVEFWFSSSVHSVTEGEGFARVGILCAPDQMLISSVCVCGARSSVAGRIRLYILCRLIHCWYCSVRISLSLSLSLSFSIFLCLSLPFFVSISISVCVFGPHSHLCSVHFVYLLKSLSLCALLPESGSRPELDIRVRWEYIWWLSRIYYVPKIVC